MLHRVPADNDCREPVIVFSKELVVVPHPADELMETAKPSEEDVVPEGQGEPLEAEDLRPRLKGVARNRF